MEMTAKHLKPAGSRHSGWGNATAMSRPGSRGEQCGLRHECRKAHRPDRLLSELSFAAPDERQGHPAKNMSAPAKM
jgi:hypothetical protein